MSYDCVIIGSGIAGMTAAIYLKRANVNVMIIEQSAPGGRLNSISKIENYPGFKSITGPDLAYNVYEQVKSLDIEIRYGKVLNIDEHIITTDIEKISSKTIIIATGRANKELDGGSKFNNISYCALCDGNLYKNKTIAVVGNKESNIDEIIYLAELVNKLYFITNNIGKTTLEKLKEYKNIEIVNNCVINTLKGKNILEEIVTNQGNYKTEGMFVLLGSEPKSNFLDNIKKVNDYVLVDSNMKTSIDYIYACGDIIKKNVYQITTAVGEAATCAISVKKYLNS